MNIIIAPDSFKGTFTSSEVIDHISQGGAKKYLGDVTIKGVPIADGGEGTVSAITTALGGTYKTCHVSGPLSRKAKATYGIADGVGVLEMAEASGIILVSEKEKDPLRASTFGTGEMIRHALDNGVTSLVIGIGGSATNDGGIGMAAALGVKFYDNEDKLITAYGGKQLSAIKRIDMSLLDKRLLDMKVTVICDVTNPLTGPEGATYVYGPQKGADEVSKPLLEEGMKNYKDVLQKTFGIDMNEVPGSGAAGGGLGAAMVAYLGAKLKPGVETILDLVDFNEMVKEADLVITGEGRIDGQSIYGKVPVGVANRCLEPKVPVIAIAGCTGTGYEAVYDHGIDVIFSTVTEPVTGEEAMNNAKINLQKTVDRLFRSVLVGRQLS